MQRGRRKQESTEREGFSLNGGHSSLSEIGDKITCQGSGRLEVWGERWNGPRLASLPEKEDWV